MRRSQSMKLSQALMFALCCIGFAGCAGLGPREPVASAPVPALPAAGPDQFAAPPPPPVPPSTITVAPQKMYNVEPKKKANPAPKPSARPGSRAVEEEEAFPPAAPVDEGPSAAAPGNDADEAAPAADDPGIVARPVRKSSKAVAPKNAPSAKPPVEVLPVSNPTSEKKVDTRLTS
jgi:hypothetical protein